MSADIISDVRCFEGRQIRVRHRSVSCGVDMIYAIYLPPVAEHQPVPVLYWLSGLTCTDENFVTKAGAQRYAAEHGIAIVAPDTSPRGEDVPDDPDAAYDFGLGAGFYVNATEAPWSRHYRMYDYVTRDLPEHVAGHFPLDAGREAISGHSMGGHGALTIALRNPGRFRSVSAFAPIVAPTQCPWGEKALSGYLGSDRAGWRAHDTVALIADAPERLELLIDQGDADNFLESQLKPHLLAEACERSGHPLRLRMRKGYDHSYFFIASFIGEHIAHHAKALKA
ncbi:MAG: S-formylglutathione hydrolase [Rhizobiales bacterium]|nr:S-formylglutathione hydrolase [Hyphomicrobiales bacterium]